MAALTPPVDPGRDHTTGPDSVPTIVEYGDFECPYCADAYVAVKALKERVGDRARFVFRQLPLEKHPHARAAALAAEAAAEQGGFWQMHDRLFEARGDLEPEDLRAYAAEIGLDVKRFEQDMGSPAVAERVDSDYASAIDSGVQGTPAFFLDGEPYRGDYDADSLEQAIEGAA